MLTADLARSRTTAEEVTPLFLDPDDERHRQTARELIQLFEAHLDEPKGDLEDAIDELTVADTDYKIVQGLAKLLKDESEFEVVAPVDPREIRRRLFERANERYPIVRQPTLGEDTQKLEVYSGLADELSISLEECYRGMYADLEDNKRLVKIGTQTAEQYASGGDTGTATSSSTLTTALTGSSTEEYEQTDLTIDWLLTRYNLALAQAVLYDATEMRIRVWMRDLSEEELQRLMDNVVKYLRVVETVSKDASLAYTVFQSQNDRGKEVSPQILAKARIHGAAEDLENETNRQQVIGRWGHIYKLLEDNLGGPRFQSDLRVRRPMTQILINSDSPTPTQIDKGALYRNFEEVLNSYDSVVEFVEWFQDQVDVYLEISSNSYDISGREIPDDAIRHLQYLNSASTHSEVLSLAIHNSVDENILLKEYFRLASILGIRMEMGGTSSANTRGAIYNIAREVREIDDSNDIRGVLRAAIESRTPTDAEIIEHLKANQLNIRGPWRFRTLLKLVSIEEERRGPLRMELDNLDIEHIAPRNTFGNSKYARWRRQLLDEEFDERKDKLGNLTLLLPNDHSSLDETSFDGKKNTYRNSDVKIAEEVADYDEWTDEQIEERTERLAQELIERWSI